MMYREEEQLQRCCVNQFKWRYSRYFRLLTHPANEGTADPKRGARLKAMGVQAGVPDLLLFVARNGYHGLAIEMKSRKGKHGGSACLKAGGGNAEGTGPENAYGKTAQSASNQTDDRGGCEGNQQIADQTQNPAEGHEFH